MLVVNWQNVFEGFLASTLFWVCLTVGTFTVLYFFRFPLRAAKRYYDIKTFQDEYGQVYGSYFCYRTYPGTISGKTTVTKFTLKIKRNIFAKNPQCIYENVDTTPPMRRRGYLTKYRSNFVAIFPDKRDIGAVFTISFFGEGIQLLSEYKIGRHTGVVQGDGFPFTAVVLMSRREVGNEHVIEVMGDNTSTFLFPKDVYQKLYKLDEIFSGGAFLKSMQPGHPILGQFGGKASPSNGSAETKP